MSDTCDTTLFPRFDPDLSPQHSVNVETAKTRNLKFDETSGFYKDADGALVRDRFGQPL
jgi:hypothetical protein